MKNEIIDLFCGCGGLSKGFEMAGFKVCNAIDMWEDAVNTYNRNANNPVAICEDIHNWDRNFLLKIKEKNNIVGVIGGPPCQGYSTVGTRDVEDPRNHLYKEYCRVVETIDPDFFVIENVKGLTTLNDGAFKDDIIKRFSKLGYKVNYKVLNAADYGIPQNRYRVFFVGLKRKLFEFPKEHVTKITVKDAISDLPSLIGDEIKNTYKCEPKNSYQKKLRNKNSVLYNHEGTKHSIQTIQIISQIKDGANIKSLPKKFWNVRKYNKAFERMNSNGQANTVDTGHRNYFHYKENRIPTVRENARIQSFSDSFIFYGSKTSQYKQVGNAVPPLLAYEVAKSIAGQLKK